MRKIQARESIICADERRRFGQGDHYRFHVDNQGDLVFSVAWDEGFNRYSENTATVLSDKDFLAHLREYYLEKMRENMERDPMDLARDKAVDDMPDGAA